MAKVIPRSKATKFSMDMKWVDHDLHVAFHGPFNEDAIFDEITEIANTPEIGLNQMVIDLGGVTHMNSCGIRKWILFLERIQTKTNLVFSLINEVVIEQACITMNILGKPGTPIQSFVVPYYCQHCKASENKVLRRSDVQKTGHGVKPPTYRCHRCSSALEIDAIEKEYFNFLNHSKV